MLPEANRTSATPLTRIDRTVGNFRPAGAVPVGAAEASLRQDEDRLSFQVKAFAIAKVVRISERSGLFNQVENWFLHRFSKVATTSVPGNMQEMVPGLIRGEQPNAAGFRYLASQGVRTVVNLTEESNLDPAWVAATGMKTVYIPEDPFGAPTLAQAQAFLRVVTTPGNQPVYFHCYHGSDRTGTMAAVYRIAVQGWSADQAIAELAPHHFNTPVELAKLQFIKAFAARWRGQADALLAMPIPLTRP